jgi:hypothetical protein
MHSNGKCGSMMGQLLHVNDMPVDTDAVTRFSVSYELSFLVLR